MNITEFGKNQFNNLKKFMEDKKTSIDQRQVAVPEVLVEDKKKDKSDTVVEDKKQKIEETNIIINDTFAYDQDYISHYILLADTKAAFILGICSGFLYIIFNKYHNFLFKNIKLWNVIDLTSFLSLLILIIAIAFTISVVYPRLLTNKKKGLVSWVDISNYESAGEYVTDLFKTNRTELIKEHYAVNYFLSIVCRKKYYWLSLSFIMAAIGIFFGLITIISL